MTNKCVSRFQESTDLMYDDQSRSRNDDDLELHKNAIFWLGQSNSSKARAALLEIVNR
ncbi:MAG: hypothetical protein ACE5IY_18080 [bacterium]